MRNMSFARTTEQIKNRTKTVTRRFGWWFLKPGDRIHAVEKGMGLKKGQKVVKLAALEVLSVRKERLDAITQRDCRREGFPSYRPKDFVRMLGGLGNQWVNRIEFKYIGD